tara:strand:+ start:741 stop:1442 length:702 start_codon:yes stop_codon:yes gene_type:complete
MKHIIKILILLNLALSFDSSFRYFTSFKQNNQIKDHFSLSATINSTDKHFFNFVKGSQKASLNFNSSSDFSFGFELIGSITDFTIDFDEDDFLDQNSYMQGNQYNINFHMLQTPLSSQIGSWALIAGYESSQTNIELFDNWDNLSYTYNVNELYAGFYVIQDFSFCFHVIYLSGYDSIDDVYTDYDYTGYDAGIVFNSSIVDYVAWQWSYNYKYYEDFDDSTESLQLKIIMDL